MKKVQIAMFGSESLKQVTQEVNKELSLLPAESIRDIKHTAHGASGSEGGWTYYTCMVIYEA